MVFGGSCWGPTIPGKLPCPEQQHGTLLGFRALNPNPLLGCYVPNMEHCWRSVCQRVILGVRPVASEGKFDFSRGLIICLCVVNAGMLYYCGNDSPKP